MLEGQRLLRIDAQEIRLFAGCHAALLVGDRGAHQVTNTSGCLCSPCFSTLAETSVLVYLDSQKVSVFYGSIPGGPREKRTLNK